MMSEEKRPSNPGEAFAHSVFESLANQEKGYWGTCPDCYAETDEHHDHPCLNVGSAHYLVCEEHRKCWHIGSNLFSSWKHESEEQHEENRVRIALMDEVEPVSNPSLVADDDGEPF